MVQRLAHSECRIDRGPIPAVVIAECRPQLLAVAGAPAYLLAGTGVGDGDSKEVQDLGNLILRVFPGGGSFSSLVMSVPERLLWPCSVEVTFWCGRQINSEH